MIRYLFNLSGNALIAGVVANGAIRSTAMQISDYLNEIRPVLDVDGNGQVDAFTDGVLAIRYMFGLRGASLIAGSVGMNATRFTDTTIENRVEPVSEQLD